MEKLPLSKKVLELSKESISIKKSLSVGGVGGGWVQPITMSASWQELNPKKEKLLPGTIAITQSGPSALPCRLTTIQHTCDHQ